MEMNSIIFLNEVGVLFCGGTVLVFQSRTINIFYRQRALTRSLAGLLKNNQRRSQVLR